MIRKSEDCAHTVVEKAVNGNGTAEFDCIWEPEKDMHSKNRLFSKITLKPGCSVGYHEHLNEEEVYYILKGQALYNDNGTESVLKAGDCTITRHGESHGIACYGDEPMEFLAVISVY